ncbi:MAG: NifU family protein [Spirochaetales bacterium]|nr:NifU family protein [Spirochaetales bacterium]
MEEQIKAAIEQIRPALQNDGGDIEFIKLDGNEVHVRLVGACAGCPMSQMTLSNGVERFLHEAVDKNLVVINDGF